jgi:hypothetical protein
MMVAICGLVWGGFAALLLRALWREKAKGGPGAADDADRDRPGRG